MENKAIDKEAAVSVADLTAQLTEAQQQKEVFQNIATIAANNLIAIENRFSPLISRKFNWINAIFHLQQYVLLVKEILEMIKEFREKYVVKPTPQA